jgi:FAD/FMN-containing dehydrogenase/Fe-S oxidoreductase
MLANHEVVHPAPPRNTQPVDAEALEQDLRQHVRGEVRFREADRALWAADASNYRQDPIGVVLPLDKDDVIATVAACHRHGAPITSRGGGTSLAGQCCNTSVIIDMSKYMTHVLDIDVDHKLARVQPGLILDHLREAAKKHGLIFGPDPATHNRNTLGGMLGNDSCGIHSVMAQFAGTGARTADNTEEMEIVTYDGLVMKVGRTSEAELQRIIHEGGRRGEIYRQMRDLRDRYVDQIRTKFPHIPRRVSGYNLPQLLPENGFNVARALVGSESTLVTILEATMNLIPNPKARSLVVLGYPDVYQAGDHVAEILEYRPIGLEGLDDLLIEFNKRIGSHLDEITLLPPGNGWLLVEFGGDSKEDSDARARRMMDRLKRDKTAPSMKLFDNPEEEELLWKVRESGLGATAFVPGMADTWGGWEDSAVAPEKVGPYLRELRALFNKYGYRPSLYGHFGQGCVHCRVDFDLRTDEGLKTYRLFLDEAADLVVRYGGSLSGEHGDGQSRAELLPKMFGDEIIEAFRQFKRIWDPDWKMNPGKVVDPYPILSNLRQGSHLVPWDPDTHFKFPDDHGSFYHAALRCVGIGECRRTEGGTMCPSYMVTREEEHTTRGRAHMLFEMMHGGIIGKTGWRDDAVRESLDLCMSCKGCKGDCPVNVDLATMKAEFLSHYYEGRLRPRSAYAMGLVHWWARLASRMPRLVNLISHMPITSTVAKWLGGIAQERDVPRFATQTFKDWFRQRPLRNVGMPQVILWPDTFNNHFHPEVARAAVEVLEDAGLQVLVPEATLCCGRPLYDYGMLDQAKRMLREIIDTLRPYIEDGVPIVGLEPSCVAVFRDELGNLFPNDQDATRLKRQAYLFGEFLEKHCASYHPPHLHRKALVHGHCHQKAVIGLSSDKAVLEKMGLDYHVAESGCCGMAGSFGFEQDHYDISQKCGERALLPAVRDASKETLIIADGFSCQEQVEQATDRRPLHLAQVIRMAMDEGPSGPVGSYPEKYAPYRELITSSSPNRLETAIAVGLGAALVGGLVAWSMRNHRT